MEPRTSPMERRIISLMCENLKGLSVDINEMAIKTPEKLIRFIHGQYEEAESMIHRSMDLEAQSEF